MKKYFAIVLALLTTCLVGCSNSESEKSSVIEENYAVNETKSAKESTQYNEESESYTDEYEGETEPVFTGEIIENEHIPYTFNAEEDVNASDVKDMNTISIDGKMVSFPCTYSDLKKDFELYQITYSRVGDFHVDVNEKDKFLETEVIATPKTGIGTIRFKLCSTTDEVQTVNDMICNEVTLSSTATNNEKLMTFALPNDIIFGTDFDTIYNTYNYFDINNMDDSSKNWTLQTMQDENDYVITFYGSDGGLTMVTIKYKEE